jgi:hypothetical protein
MTKKNILAILVLLMIFSVIAYFYLDHQRFVIQRHHLLCEILKPDMSKDEVLRILEQAGDITINDALWSNKFGGELFIIFTDPKGRDNYGSFNLYFRDNKYEAAYVRIGSDDSESICDFYQPKSSATPIP